MEWNSIRKPYQEHIRCLTRYADYLSEQHIRTGEQFFLEEYHHTVQAIQRLKQWITDQENCKNTTV